MSFKIKRDVYENIRRKVERLEKAVDASLHRMLYSGKVVRLIQTGGPERKTLYEVQLDEGTILVCSIGSELTATETHLDVRDRVEVEYQDGSLNKGLIVAV